MEPALSPVLQECRCTAWSTFAPCRPFLASAMTPMPWQRALLHSIRPGSRAIALGSRQGMGKTTSAAAVALLVASVAAGRTVAVLGPSEAAPKEFVRRCKPMAEAMGLRIAGNSQTVVEFEVGAGTSRIVALPANVENIRGLTCHALIGEESRGISAELFASAIPFLATTNGALVLIGTPGAPQGPLWDRWSDPDAAWQRWRVTAEDLVTAGRLTREFVDEQKASMSDLDFRREFASEFVSAEGSLFSPDDLERAFARGAEVADIFDNLEGF